MSLKAPLPRLLAFAAGLPVVALALGALSQPVSAAPTVQNGSFETTVGSASELVTNSNLPGWQTTSTYTFVVAPGGATVKLDNANPIKLWAFPSVSPSGGNFLLQDSNFQVGTLTQQINELVTGATYSVSFYQAAGQQKDFYGATWDYWHVSFGTTLAAVQADTPTNNTAVSQDSTRMDVATPTTDGNGVTTGYYNAGGWMIQTMTFVATATTEWLGFLAIGTPAGQPPFAALDGVTITRVPEPATWLLVGVGLLGLTMLRRAKTRRA